jgi:hypothetical protein
VGAVYKNSSLFLFVSWYNELSLLPASERKTYYFTTYNLILGMTKLSVNINKFATLRNSRGGNNPDVVKAAIDAQRFGADGVTVHPRPDERHIRYNDVRAIKKIITTEFNIEGNCSDQKFVDLVL